MRGSVPITDRAGIRAILPARARDAHKGSLGHVLVVAGGQGMAGAAALCAQGALRGGCGLVTVACPGSIVPIVQQLAPCAMALPLPERDGRLDSAAAEELARAWAGKAALAVGPGLGAMPEVADALAPLWQADVPRVLDADALNLLAAMDTWPLLGGKAILTPHPGEMARLLGMPTDLVQANRQGSALRLVERTGAVVLLKGADTLIADASRMRMNPTGCSGMATGGSGDVLTGLIASLCAQGITAYEAAVAGAYIHGLAGEIAQDAYGTRGMTAWDLQLCIAEALKQFE